MRDTIQIKEQNHIRHGKQRLNGTRDQVAYQLAQETVSWFCWAMQQ